MNRPASRTPRMADRSGELHLNAAGVARWLAELDEADGREMSASRPDLWALVVRYQERVKARLLIAPDVDDAIASVVDVDTLEREIVEHGADAPAVMLRRVCAGGAS